MSGGGFNEVESAESASDLAITSESAIWEGFRGSLAVLNAALKESSKSTLPEQQLQRNSSGAPSSKSDSGTKVNNTSTLLELQSLQHYQGLIT